MGDQPIPGRCNARTRRGSYCRKWPTKANGKRCYLHGGAPGSGRPIETGRYSAIARGALREKYQHFLSDEQYRDLRCEIAVERALFGEYLASFQDGKAPGPEDTDRMMSWLDKIGRLVERVARIENVSALTAREVQLLEAIIIRLLCDYLTEEKRDEFSDKLAEALGSARGLLELPAAEEVRAVRYEEM